MKVVYLSYNPQPGYDSPATWVDKIKSSAGIMEALSRYHEIVYIKKINYTGEYLNNGVKYIFLQPPVKSRFPKDIHELVKKANPDIVIVSGTIYPLQVIQLSRSVGKNVKIIVQNHAEVPGEGLKKLAQRWADRYIDAYFFPTKEMGSTWISKGNLSKSARIFETMELSTSFHRMDRQTALQQTGVTGYPTFIWVARLIRLKNPLTVVKAFLRFAEITGKARLYMIFDNEEMLPEIKELLAKEKKYRDSIVLVGKQSHDKLQSWYSSVDFYISGSEREGTQSALSEAMACGCIPIVTHIPSFRRMTGVAGDGLLYAVEDENGLVDILKTTLTMNLVARREKVIRQFDEELSFEAIAKKIVANLNEIVKTVS